MTAAIAQKVSVEDSWRVGIEDPTVEFEPIDRTRLGLSLEEPHEMAERPPRGLGWKTNIDEDLSAIANDVDLELRRLEDDDAVAEELRRMAIYARATETVLSSKHPQCLGGATK